MKRTIQNVAAVFLSLQMLNVSALRADDVKVPEKVSQVVRETEKQPSEQEKTEMGESSGNISDCDQPDGSGEAENGVDDKDLDECKVLVK